jgi:pimeloyl-ACP methyl ester carboxylesterase
MSVGSRHVLSAGSLGLSAVRWPRPATSEGSAVHASGNQRPRALLVHGLASNALLWEPAAIELGRLGWECVGVDLRGHGRSDKPDDGYDHHTVARDCSLVLDALGWDEAVVIGQSWGANIAVEVAGADERVVGAVAVDGGTIELGSVFETWEACEATLAPPVFADRQAAEIEDNMMKWHSDWSPAAIAGAMGCFETLADGTVRPWLERHRHLAILHDLWSHRVTSTYSRIECPFLFTPADSGEVGWADDKRASVERALQALRRGEVVWFPGADHDLHAQKPVEFADAVDTWWERNR